MAVLSEMSDHQKMIEEMRQLGLRRVTPAPTCRLCRFGCEWIADDNEYCFVCVRKGRVKFQYPPAQWIGKLHRHADHTQPELYIRLLNGGMYRVAKQGNRFWDDAVMEKCEFQWVRPAVPVRID